MKSAIQTIFLILMLSQSGMCQDEITLKDWSFLNDSNIVVLFARSEFNTNYLLIPVESYYKAIDRYLLNNERMDEFITELGIGCVYDNYTFNGGVGNPYLVYKEKKIYTSYGRDIKVGEKLSPYYCISEIIFNESLRVNPEFVIIDNNSVSKIKNYASGGQYRKGTWLDTTIIVLERGEKAELVLEHEKSRKWPASMFSKTNKTESDDHKSDGLEGIIEKKKLPRMDCYRPKVSLKDSNIEKRTTLLIEN